MYVCVYVSVCYLNSGDWELLIVALVRAFVLFVYSCSIFVIFLRLSFIKNQLNFIDSMERKKESESE